MRDKILDKLRGLDWSLVGMICAIKVLVFWFAAQSYQVWANQAIGSWRVYLEIWNRWDAIHYLEVAQYGYRMAGDSKYRLVLFPLYPWLARVFAFFTGGDYLVAAFVVSTLASIVAGLLLQRLVLLDYGADVARRAVLFLFIFPTSYFLHIGYTESLFLALGLGCFLAARTNRWALCGALGVLACMSRINGLILIPALMVEAFQQYRTTRVWRREWLWMALMPIGFGVYLLINYNVSGDPLMFAELQRQNWAKSLAPPWSGIAGTLDSIWGRAPSDAVMIGTQEFVFIALSLACIIRGWFMLRPSYSVWMTFNWLLFTSVGFVLCVPRYVLVMFPIAILFARFAERLTYAVIITTWSVLFLALFITRFIQGHWAF